MPQTAGLCEGELVVGGASDPTNSCQALRFAWNCLAPPRAALGIAQASRPQAELGEFLDFRVCTASGLHTPHGYTRKYWCGGRAMVTRRSAGAGGADRAGVGSPVGRRVWRVGQTWRYGDRGRGRRGWRDRVWALRNLLLSVGACRLGGSGARPARVGSGGPNLGDVGGGSLSGSDCERRSALVTDPPHTCRTSHPLADFHIVHCSCW